ncbi:cation:proton antiporter regulatory subunit [Paenibacillus aurantiacus]|uniref:Cation:proton antiporter regulatory subunit n=1 Tax=Paenibacillus aurantiacus TaxID=1936118 RepID=A0ABV5KR44_9BACL
MNIREIELPGIGKKFEMITRAGDKVVVIVHDDGRRECYHFEHGDPSASRSMVTLDDDESRLLAGIIGGMAYAPKALETIEMALGDLILEWYRVEPSFKCVGKTIGELDVRQSTGATIIAVIGRGAAKQVNPGPETLLIADSVLVVAGERGQQKLFKEMIMNGRDGAYGLHRI